MVKQLVATLFLVTLGGFLWLRYGHHHLDDLRFEWRHEPPAGLSRTFQKKGPIYAAISARGEGPDAKLALLQHIGQDSFFELRDLASGQALIKDQWTRATIPLEMKFLDTARGEVLVILSGSSDEDELTIRLIDTKTRQTRWIKNFDLRSQEITRHASWRGERYLIEHHEDKLTVAISHAHVLSAGTFSIREGVLLQSTYSYDDRLVKNVKNQRYERRDERGRLCWLGLTPSGIDHVCEAEKLPKVKQISKEQVTVEGEDSPSLLPALPPLAKYQDAPKHQEHRHEHPVNAWIFPLQYPGTRAGELIAIDPLTRTIKWRVPTSPGAKQWVVVGERIVGWTQTAKRNHYRVDVHRRDHGALLSSYELSSGRWSCRSIKAEALSDSVFALDACGAHWVISDRILNAVEGGDAMMRPWTP